jgi:hypothetical protein
MSARARGVHFPAVNRDDAPPEHARQCRCCTKRHTTALPGWGSIASSGEADGEGLQAVHQADGTPAEFLRGDRERYSWEAGEQGAEGHLGLHAGQGSAQAVMNAVAEGEVAAGVAAEVEAVRAGEPGAPLIRL